MLGGSWECDMLGRKERDQLELFITGSLRQLVPDDHMSSPECDGVLDLSWLRGGGRRSSTARQRTAGDRPRGRRSGSCSRASCSASSMIGD